MVFRRSIRPVNSIKHIVDKQGALGVATQVIETLAVAKELPAVAAAADVELRSTINGIFLNVQVAGTSTAALSNVYMALVKNPGNNLTFPNANVLGVADEKRFVIHQEMIMTEKNSTAIPRTLFKGVLKIPRGYRRFGIKDQLQLLLFAPGTTYEYCIQCIYKNYQ